MKPFVEILICILLVNLASQSFAYEEEDTDGYESFHSIEKRATRQSIGCSKGGFTCKATGQRGISCSTDSKCRGCKIIKAGGGALNLYCNDRRNPNGYYRCQTLNGQVSCIG